MRVFLLLLLPALALAQTGTVERKVDPAREVVVIVNDSVPESVAVGRHYCAKRGVPEANILHVKCTEKEVMAWSEFRDQIQRPFVRFAEAFPDVLYVVPCWGVPSRIAEEDPSDDAPKEDPDNTITKFVTNRDYACVDAEIALLPRPEHEINGWIESDLFRKDEPVTKAHRLLLVSRLDGPTAAVAKGLVDKAIHAETYGLEGTNYLDTRGIASGPYGATDEEMRGTLKVFEKFGLAIEHEDTETEQDVSKLADCLFYWGWYAGDYNGTEPFRFRTGAVAAHLHSCSACSVRHDTKYWVGPFLAHGVTCTTGTVYEPLTAGFPRMHVVYDRMFQGYTWGQATAMGNQMLSWMAVFVGDPLYAPYAKGLKEVQERNLALARDGYGKAAGQVDAGDLDGAVKTLDDIGAIGVPYEGAQDSTFLRREIAARRLGKTSGTVADLVKAIKAGEAALKTGDTKAAIAAFEKALALSSMNFDANLAIGTIHAEAGKAATGLSFLEKAQKVEPSSPPLAAPLGRALAATGKFKEAIPVLEAAVAAGAGGDVLAVLGDCHLKAQDVPKAIQVLTDALEADPGNRAAVLTLARAYEASKEWALQMAMLKDAVKIAPQTMDDVSAYRKTWQALESAADRAKDKKERDNATLVLKDFENPAFAPTTRGVWLEAGKSIDDLAGESGASALGELPARDLRVAGLPRLQSGNAGAAEVTIYLHGPCSRSVKLKPWSGIGTPQPREIGVFPGEYLVVVVLQKGKDRAILTGRKTFELNREYGMVVDNNKAMTFPPPR
ncbi:MAG: TIGR03790 family protein [Planctomycetes bacterium]|nr:TIGR03790 family protein [Planctomycetota bacterium]